ncbi:tRNA pseudouridine(55) synthase TruB [Ruficoccus sp. ZRK36]|uniref:tRNA pseudouridine(55) synthase TruB n=1 Tax=Ruficoccus sp. ZRK36 TaxID=2866311 RepID=UPI001C739355|nr:tRNA pseudouridine(55) synthase TruB [Ruficoccus sp. ZRK36]QYY35336.1 tRNA pseudouridine(55) synthase TruB [Ruficoccus sp. ZRK36]
MTPTTQNDFEGVLLVDKPCGPTSHDVVDRLRRKLKMKRIGHAGTLDPNATGLLIMLIGRATKVSQYLMSLDKAYEGTIKLGEETNTYDSDGEVVETKPLPDGLDAAGIDTVLQSFVGDQYQLPPMFSAKKIDGVPLYKLARKGKEVKRDPRFIRISEIELLDYTEPCAEIGMACSKGTYVRTLAHDVGQKIGCGAHLSELRRIAVGHFHVEDAATLEELEEMSLTAFRRRLIPIYQAVPSHVL